MFGGFCRGSAYAKPSFRDFEALGPIDGVYPPVVIRQRRHLVIVRPGHRSKSHKGMLAPPKHVHIHGYIRPPRAVMAQ